MIVENWYRQIGFADPEAVPQEIVEAALYNAQQPNAVYSIFPFLNGTLRYDIAPLLQSATAPAIMLWGAEEIQIPASARERIQAVNPAIDVARIPGARSVFEVEQPDRTLEVLQKSFT